MRARKVDSTHAEIRDGLRSLGMSVHDMSAVGSGFPDLLIGTRGLDFKIEAKTPRGYKTALDRFTPEQIKFREEWRGSQVIAAYSLEDALFHIKRLLKLKGG